MKHEEQRSDLSFTSKRRFSLNASIKEGLESTSEGMQMMPTKHNFTTFSFEIETFGFVLFAFASNVTLCSQLLCVVFYKLINPKISAVIHLKAKLT